MRAPWALAAAVLLSACLPQDAPQTTTTDGIPTPGGRLVFGTTRDIRTLQPLHSIDGPSQNVIDLIYAPLLRNDAQTGEPAPGLAERFEVSADGQTVSYVLRRGLVWSDGDDLTAHDVKYTLEAWARSKRAPRGIVPEIVGYEEYILGRASELTGVGVADNGQRVTITLRRRLCAAARALAGQPLPRHVFERYWHSATTDVTSSIDDAPANLAPTVASGPFRFAEHRPGVHVRVVRNDRYYLGAPLIDEVIFKIYGDSQAIKAALMVGELASAGTSPNDVAEIRASQAASRLRMIGPSPTSNYLTIMLSHRSPAVPWLRDRRIRQALWHGLNVDEMVERLLAGQARRHFAQMPEQHWAYDGEGLDRYPYDPQRARQLLESAGARLGPDGIYRWTDGRPMRLRIETSQADTLRVTILQVAQEQYKAIGIGVEPSLTSFPALVDRLETRADVQAVIIAPGIAPEPEGAGGGAHHWHSSQIAPGGANFMAFSHPAIDAALDAARYGPDCSQAARRKAYATVDRILNEEAPYIFLFSPHALAFRRTDFVAPEPTPWGGLWHRVETWWLRR